MEYCKYKIKSLVVNGEVKYMVYRNDEILINKYYKTYQTAYVAFCKYLTKERLNNENK